MVSADVLGQNMQYAPQCAPPAWRCGCPEFPTIAYTRIVVCIVAEPSSKAPVTMLVKKAS